MLTAAGEAFGDLLRRYRKAAGLTQEELAERAELSVRAVAYLEQGAIKRPRRDSLQLLAVALALSAQEQAALEVAARRPVVAPPGPVPTVLPSVAGGAPLRLE